MQQDYNLKKLILGLWSNLISEPSRSDPGLQTKISFDMFHIYCSSVCMQKSGKKILTIEVVIYFKFDTA